MDSDNVAIGKNVLIESKQGSYNVGVGSGALTLNERYDNTSIGYRTMLLNKNGKENVTIGSQALRIDSSGSENGRDWSFSYTRWPIYSASVFIGSESGRNAEGVSNSVVIGRKAGYNSTGGGNVFLGKESGFKESGSNKLYIHNDTSSSPLIYGEFDNRVLQHNGRTIFNPDTTDVNIEITYKVEGLSKEPFIRPSSPNYGYLGDEQNYLYKIYSRFFMRRMPLTI